MGRNRIVSFTVERGRAIALEWIKREWRAYANDKFGDVHAKYADDVKVHGFGEDSFYYLQVSNYINRMRTYGLDTPNGRQAAMKVATTYIDFLRVMIDVYGPPPEPGHGSGELIDPTFHHAYDNTDQGVAMG